MRRFVFFSVTCAMIASGFVGYAIGYLQVGAECVKIYNEGAKLNNAEGYKRGFEAGYEMGFEDGSRLHKPVPIKPRPKPKGPTA